MRLPNAMGELSYEYRFLSGMDQNIFDNSHQTFFINLERAVIDPITKTCLYNFDPLKPHLYKVKLGFSGVYIIFLIFAQTHRL